MCFFFFSSRRRHTRCSRDWSSDVCSSDLCGLLGPNACCIAGGVAYWMGNQQFFSYAGAVRPLPCDVSDRVFSDLSQAQRSEEHTSELQSRLHLVCRLLLVKKKIYQDMSAI